MQLQGHKAEVLIGARRSMMQMNADGEQVSTVQQYCGTR
jgi:hypothetical protein